jgi:MFS family permease
MPPVKRGFGVGYWLLNLAEAGERLAFYAVWPIAGIYIMQANEPGGLHLTAGHKATIFAWFSIMQAILPIVTGGYADRYGYKKTLVAAMLVNMAAYLLMAAFRSYGAVFAAIVMLGLGTSLFKPAIQGGLAHSMSREASSVGWGIFYGVINLGATFGPWISPAILKHKSPEAYQHLFLFCAAVCLAVLLLILFFRDVPSGASLTQSPWQVLAATARNILEPRLLAWLIIMSGFWLMMYQLWDNMPNFIVDWVDSSALARIMPVKSWREIGPDGVLCVPQQVLVSLNAFLIFVLVVPVSYFVRKRRTLSAMLLGTIAVTIGLMIAGFTQSVWFLLTGIVFYSLGEMLVGPKKSEYLALIAPSGKKALYLGYVVIPTGIGRGVGNSLGGYLYGHFGEKATLAQRYLVEHTPWGAGRSWDGNLATLGKVAGVSRIEAYAKLQSVLGKSGPEVTDILWNTYDPQLWFWLPFIGIGVVSAIALFIFGRMARRWGDMNA